MPLPGVRRVTDLLDRLLRPQQAAANAGGAATDTTNGRKRRQQIEREVAILTTDAAPQVDE